jgi:hypothetical protein
MVEGVMKVSRNNFFLQKTLYSSIHASLRSIKKNTERKKSVMAEYLDNPLLFSFTVENNEGFFNVKHEMSLKNTSFKLFTAVFVRHEPIRTSQRFSLAP